jgi:hypothetical protein
MRLRLQLRELGGDCASKGIGAILLDVGRQRDRKRRMLGPVRDPADDE